MKLLNYFKKKNKSKNKITIEPDEEYIKSTLVHVDYLTSESEDPIMYILFTFSNSYCPSAIDIINNMILERSIYIQTSDDIETEELDEDGNQIINSIPKNYLLMPLQISHIESLINNIDIANPFLNKIINEAYDNINSSYFKNIDIYNTILNKNLFMNRNINTKENMLEYNNIIYTDIQELLKKLPSEFSGIDLCYILYMNIRGAIFKLDEIYKIYLTEDEIIHVYNGALKNPSRENINKLNEPLYKRNIDEDELIHGDLSSHDIDQIFKEQYNRFSAIANDNTSYMDIDEVVFEDDPEYNNLQNNNEEIY